MDECTGRLRCARCACWFRVPRSAATRRKFCSWACRNDSLKQSCPVGFAECKHCGREFSHHASERRVYCGRACMAAGRHATRAAIMRSEDPLWGACFVSCGHCAKPMRVPPSKPKGGRGKFCSRSCALLARPHTHVSKIATDAIDEWATGTSELWVQEYRIGPYSIDLALPLRRIAVELDGEYWHSLPNVRHNDATKTSFLSNRGWRVVRVVMVKADTPGSVANKIEAELRKVQADERRALRGQRRRGA